MLHEILRDIQKNRIFFLYFVLNLSLGLFGLVGLLGFKASFERSIEERSKIILGSDLAIYSRAKQSEDLKVEVEKKLPSPFTRVENLSMFSMLKAKNKSRLINVKTVPEGFPFYGDIVFRIDHEKSTEFEEGKTVWIYPEIATQLKLEIGDSVSLGHATFIIENIVDKDPQQTFQMGAMAPRVYISPRGEKRAKLLQKGSTAFHGILYKLPEGSDLEDISKKVEKVFTEVGPKVVTPRSSGEQVGRFIQYLSDFLGLVSLVALFLSSVGLFYLFRSFVSKKRKEMAIYLALGRSKKNIRKYFNIYLMILGLSGTLIGLATGNLLFFSLSFLMDHLFTFEARFHIDPFFTVLTFLIGTVGTFLIGYPLLQRGLSSGANDLFQENIGKLDLRPGVYWFLPWFVFYWGIGVFVSHSLKVGTLFFGLFILQAILGMVLLYPLLKLVETSSHSFKLTTKHALLYLSRHKASSMAGFLAIAQGVLLLTLIPQIRSGLHSELNDVDGVKTPSLFLFDIQEDQVEGVRNFFEKRNKPLLGVSPMIRGRITKMNDEEFKRPKEKGLTREEEREIRFRNRGVNLSYRQILHESETIVEGRPFKGEYQEGSNKLPELSVEARYANRLGVEIGDKVGFEVLGMPVEGRVVNKRKVKWTSFHPNFFLMFQPGVLDDAPKTFLGVSDNLTTDFKDNVQVELFEKFPNVSVVDISRIVERVLIVLSRMSFVMGAMAILSLMAGLFVLYSLIVHQLEERSRDAGLFKLMGVSRSSLRSIVTKEFVYLTITASLFGSIGSILVSFAMAKILFDGLWIPMISLPLVITASLASITMLMCWVSTRKLFGKKTIELVMPFS